MKIDPNTVNVLDILNEAKAYWWLDSGTLLGYVRDNNIIQWDTDFDLSILVENEIEVQRLVGFFIDQGMTVRIYCYQNKIVKLKILNKSMIVDIQVFRQISNQLISYFAYYGAKPNTEKNSIKNLFYRANSRLFLKKIEKRMHAKKKINISILKLLFCARVGSWVYKVEDIFPLQSNEDFNVPCLYKKYLTFRYGTWMHPNKEWDSYTMDGARNY